MSKAKAMGTAVETAAVSWLIEHGFPDAERLALAGAWDRGDVRLQRAPTVVAECKRAQRGFSPTPWLRELDAEVSNAGAAFGILVAKQAGAGDRRVHRWVSAMRYDAFRIMLASYNVDQRHISEPGYEIEEWSPTALNSTYVPMLSGPITRAAIYRNGGPVVPFAASYTPGRRDQRFLVGPLEQFVTVFLSVGYGRSPS